jgi:putative flippase GtrA
MKILFFLFSRYMIVGTAAYSIDLILFVTARSLFEASIPHANILARASGALAAFLLNYQYTFKSTTRGLSQSFFRYLVLWCFNTFLSTTFILQFSSPVFVYNEIYFKVAIEILLVLTNFLICKFWIYKS